MNHTQTPQHTFQNHILDSLPAQEYERIVPHLEELRMKFGDILSRPDEKIGYVYFPKHGII